MTGVIPEFPASHALFPAGRTPVFAADPSGYYVLRPLPVLRFIQGFRREPLLGYICQQEMKNFNTWSLSFFKKKNVVVIIA